MLHERHWPCLALALLLCSTPSCDKGAVAPNHPPSKSLAPPSPGSQQGDAPTAKLVQSQIAIGRWRVILSGKYHAIIDRYTGDEALTDGNRTIAFTRRTFSPPVIPERHLRLLRAEYVPPDSIPVSLADSETVTRVGYLTRDADANDGPMHTLHVIAMSPQTFLCMQIRYADEGDANWARTVAESTQLVTDD